ncbi:restriction endonuclease [Oceanibaculum nanhaiense]|uniref:restriction endonuclease n=1 Tax=Oceanibaculum nanhaiense TaxID=1909734 RepID=UPI003D2DAC9F
MPKIRPIDMTTIDQIFGMESGYVLDFSDRTFAAFFADELNIEIDDEAYHAEGSSKAKRLRYFLKQANADLAVRTLRALWEYREARRLQREADETVTNAQGRLLDIIERLAGRKPMSETMAMRPAYNWPAIAEMRQQLHALTDYPPQERGYLFEGFLKSTFDLFGMRARDPFRNRGEQIDGSFELANEVYLLEAKWLNTPVGIGDLHAFHGKIEQKAAWARGLFISYSGFSQDGLLAFGRGKRIVCMDGFDLDEAFRRQIPVSSVIEQKVRRAAETGNCFVSVRDLFLE